MKILLTGVAGFIGAHLARRLSVMGYDVIGLDSLDDYYDIKLKYDRIKILGGIESDKISDSHFTKSKVFDNYKFIQINTQDRNKIEKLFRKEAFELVCHLAAQPGVRYSIQNPYAYTDNNINGFITILEGCRHNMVRKLLYASSSSVYGNSKTVPFREETNVECPVSLYAATKRANELMASVYAHLYDLTTTGVRLFTVYGPWGRPDMAPFLFTKAIFNGDPIELYNSGNLYRDFTFIDDVIESLVRLLLDENEERQNETCRSEIFNIGNHTPVSILKFIKCLEQNIGKKAIIEKLPMQPGDVYTTFADVSKLLSTIGFSPATPIQTGIGNFISWYRQYYSVG